MRALASNIIATAIVWFFVALLIYLFRWFFRQSLEESFRTVMREEFECQEKIGNVFYNDTDYALRKKD